MAFLDWFSSSPIPENWRIVSEATQLDEMERQSMQHPIALLKHSTRCGISHSVLDQLVQGWQDDPVCPMFYLDLLSYRPLSNAIADRWDIAHQSPQLLVLGEGDLIYHASHHAINWSKVVQLIASYKGG